MGPFRPRRRGSSRPPLGTTIVTVLTLAMLVMTGCGADEPVVDDVAATEGAPSDAGVDEPAEAAPAPPEAPTGPDGDPELVWSVSHENPISAFSLSPDGETLAVGEWATYLHQVADGLLLDVFVHTHVPSDLAFAPDGEVLGVGLGLGGVVLLDPADGTELQKVGDGYDNRLAFAPDGTQLATGNREGVVWLWSADGTEQLAALDDDAEYVDSLEYHPDGEVLGAVDFDCVTRIWDLGDESVDRVLDLDAGLSCYHMGPFGFSPDGQVMAGAFVEDWEQSLQLLTTEDATQRWEVPVPGQVRDLGFSPDGALLAVAPREATLILDVETGAVIHALDPPSEEGASTYPTRVVFTPDGGHLAVGHWDGTVELWRLPGAEELVAPEVEPCEPLPIPGDVLFDTGAADLRPEADAVLTELAEQLRDGFPEATLTFVGHTDSRGDAADNQQLSVDRAEAVASWFEDWAEGDGLTGWQVRTEGKGDTELKVEDTNADGEFLAEAGALNRRVEIDIDAEGCTR
jgi:outer membrane protein OmpA-like peptidoglycan-associated protein